MTFQVVMVGSDGIIAGSDRKIGIRDTRTDELFNDAGPWQFVAPVGDLSDSKHERYDLHLPASALKGEGGEHLLTVRVYDRYENVGVAKTVFGSAAK